MTTPAISPTQHDRPLLKAVLLDLDGTLLDTIADLAAAVNGMREELSMKPLSVARITALVGKGADHLIRQSLLADQDPPQLTVSAFEQARVIFSRHYTLHNGKAAKLYPGVSQGLKDLLAMGVRLAVVTNKPTAFTGPLLEQTGLAQYMSVVVCGDTCEKRKPDPQPVLYACEQLGVTPEQCLFIGDSMNDALAARGAGCRVLAVPYGYSEGISVDKLPVDGIVQTLVDAATWARQHFTWTDP